MAGGFTWPVTLECGDLVLRPIRYRDRKEWSELRSRNDKWLAPWEASNPVPGGGLPDYRQIEEIVAAAVRARFGLVGTLPPEVKRIDLVLLASEAATLHQPPPRDWQLPEEPLRCWRPACWSPKEARSRFLATFTELFPEVA